MTHNNYVGNGNRYNTEPKTSYGIIALKLDTPNEIDMTNTINFLSKLKQITDCDIQCDTEAQIQYFALYKNILKMLLIMRKHTVGYLAFVKGSYSISNMKYIFYLFKQMTPEEINKIKKYTFDDLWNDVWYGHSRQNNAHYLSAKNKYLFLLNNEKINLHDILKSSRSLYDTPEWGIPKGRRIVGESDLDCAIREFNEETNLSRDDYILFDNIKPLEENLIGTDGIKYKHIYYVAVIKNKQHNVSNIDDGARIIGTNYEIGDMGYFNVDEAIGKIRDYHTERHRIIRNVCLNIIQYLSTHCNKS